MTREDRGRDQSIPERLSAPAGNPTATARGWRVTNLVNALKSHLRLKLGGLKGEKLRNDLDRTRSSRFGRNRPQAKGWAQRCDFRAIGGFWMPDEKRKAG